MNFVFLEDHLGCNEEDELKERKLDELIAGYFALVST